MVDGNWIFVSLYVFIVSASNLYADETGPKLIFADWSTMIAAKEKYSRQDPSLAEAFRKFFVDVGVETKRAPQSVMEKARLPPSGDRHDFISLPAYYWGNTNSSSDGAYKHTDGVRNPEVDVDSDAVRLRYVCVGTNILALANFFTGDEKYAREAVHKLRVFFLNDATKMNPNLQYAHCIPGSPFGRESGVINALYLAMLPDTVSLLTASGWWTAADQEGMVTWAKDYFRWLTTHKMGKKESAKKNNHGSYYDVQAAALAILIGDTKKAVQIVTKARSKRIAHQIEPNGSQPKELSRPISLFYSHYNLVALCDLACIAQYVGVDLWHYETDDGRSILKALEFLAPYTDWDKEWPYQQLHPADRNTVTSLIRRTAYHYPRSNLSEYLRRLPVERRFTRDRYLLLFPAADMDVVRVSGGSNGLVEQQQQHDVVFNVGLTVGFISVFVLVFFICFFVKVCKRLSVVRFRYARV